MRSGRRACRRRGDATFGADGVSIAPDGKLCGKDLQSAPKRVRDGAGKLFEVGSGALRPIA